MKPFDGADGRSINEKIILLMEAGLMKNPVYVEAGLM